MTAAAPPPEPLSKDARRKMVAARKQTSLYWRLVHLLGSLKLALVLLATIAIAIAAATFFESAFNAKIAAATVYKNPFFIGWLGVLCINLFAVTLTRWPWERKHTGFIVTHYGIILLLIGAVVGTLLGFEGNVTLHTEKAPVARITTSRSVLQVESPRDGALYLIDFDAEARLPSERRPTVLPLPDTDYKLVADDFSPNLLDEERLTASAEPAALPGVELHLHSDTAGQHLDLPLVLQPDGGIERDFFGMARIAFLPTLPDRAAKPITETRMIFAKYAPVITAEDGTTGVAVTLSEDGTQVTTTTPDGTAATYARAEILNQPLTVGPVTVTLGDYWPDFVIKDGRPTTASPEANNPAALVRITGPAQVGAPDDASGGLVLEIAPGPAGSIVWQSVRNGTATASGTAKKGDTFAPGWADWSAEVTEFLPEAALATDTRPGDAEVKGIPGFRARLRAPDGTEGPATWVASGDLTTLGHDRTVVRLGYGLELRPAPFSIGLENFEVPRYEGTETPANYISTVKFTDSETGATKTAVAQMNQPASWPGGLLANLTGINYKFSQAEWNPRDLNETTLQVLYDPGWLLKWTGSLAICAGIFIQFYLKPKRRTAPAPQANPQSTIRNPQ
ncbi:MAG: hypothetical protein WA771_08555 [Chthoniobacterales bacterium]